MKKSLLALFYCLTTYTAFPQEEGWPLLRNYTPKEYGGKPQVFSILRDKNTGIAYFGTEPGMVSYDGVRWRVIPTTSKTAARSISQDENGTIYVTASDEFGRLATDKRGQTVFQSLRDRMPDSTLLLGDVYAVKTAKGAAYFKTNEYVFRYESASDKMQVFKADTNGRFSGDFTFKDAYYVVLLKQGLMKIDQSGIAPALQSAFFKNKNNFRDAVRYNAGSFLIATRTGGLYLYHPEKDIAPTKFHAADTGFIADNNMYSAHRTSGGAILLGSTKKGALLIDNSGKTLGRFNEGNLLQNNTVYNAHSGEGQPLWLGLANGVGKTSQGGAWSFRDGRSGIKGMVLDVVRHQGKMYVATLESIYYLDESGVPVEIQGVPTGPNWVLLRHNEMLLTGTHVGIFQIKDGRATPVYQGGHAFVLYPSRQNPNRLFATDGTQSVISLLYENGKLKTEGAWAGIKDQVRAIAEDASGGLWLSTYNNGIIKTRPGKNNPTVPDKVKYYTEKDGLPGLNNCYSFMYQDKLLVGTEKGLFVYDSIKDRFAPYCGLGQIFCEGKQDVYRFQEMKNGKIYISPFNNNLSSIGYLKPDGKGAYQWGYQAFKSLPEMAEVGNIFAEENGLFWIGSSEGLFRYDENKDVSEYGLSFQCWVREVKAGDSTVYFGGGPNANIAKADLQTFGYAGNSLKFFYAAPFFDEEQRTLYSYQMQGFDDKWSPWETQTEKEYTNLYEGAYLFKAKAKNIYGVESALASYAFEIRPPWHRTWWAYFAYIVFAAFTVWGTVHYNSRRLLLQKKRLEDLVAKRTEDLASKNQELELSNQEIQQQNEEIQQQSEEISSQRDVLEERNETLFLQKEEISRSHENAKMLAQIGQELSSTLDLSIIVNTLYERVNELMPAEVFGIGLYHEANGLIEYKLAVENGVHYKPYSRDMKNKNQYPVWCIEKREAIFINDETSEYSRYITKDTDKETLGRELESGVRAGQPNSLIYIPLLANGKVKGIITVQSFRKHAYTEYHQNILNGLGVYAAAALENAELYGQTEKLLLNILPKETAEELKENGVAATKSYEKVSVLFTDFKNFTQISEKMTPEEVVKNLDYCFRAFDKICKKHGMEKIKTIGDAYMAAGGIPKADEDNPIRAVAAAADMLAFMEKWKQEKTEKGERVWQIRIGIHTGPVVAGVVGEDKFAYDIWGDTVNTAARMESAGEPGRINISSVTRDIIEQTLLGAPPEQAILWQFEYRGKISAKGKGEIGMYFVTGPGRPL